MIVNLASVANGLPGGAPGSLLFQHPEYVKRWWWREFGRVSYIGGREYHSPTQIKVMFEQPVIEIVDGLRKQTGVEELAYRSLLYRHNREQSWEYVNRQKRSYYHNFVRTIVNSLVSHALKKETTREGSELLTKFWDGVDCKRQKKIETFMRTGLRWAAVEGIMWACVDAPEEAGGLPYAYWVNPIDILDWEVDDDGEIVWLKQFVYASESREWNQGIVPRFRFRIWRRDGVETFETDHTGGGQKKLETRSYSLGRVPFVPLFSIRDEDYDFPDGMPLAGDLCKTANHIYNLGSLLSEIGYKQTFSWLTIPDKNVDVLQAGLNTAFGYDAQNGGKPEYISPDAEQARVLMEMMRDAIEQARQSIGVGRGRSDGSMAKSSGEAIQLEDEDKRSILADIASEAQDFEIRLADMVSAYKAPGHVSKNGKPPTIRYGMDFDLRSFKAEVDDALAMKNFGMSPEVNLALAEDLVERKFAGIDKAEMDALVASLKAEMDKRMADAAKMQTGMVDANGEPIQAQTGGDNGQKPPPAATSNQPPPATSAAPAKAA